MAFISSAYNGGRHRRQAGFAIVDEVCVITGTFGLVPAVSAFERAGNAHLAKDYRGTRAAADRAQATLAEDPVVLRRDAVIHPTQRTGPSPAALAAIREAQTKRWARVRAAGLPKQPPPPMSPQAKARMAEAMRARMADPEQRARLIAAQAAGRERKRAAQQPPPAP